jgi:hypothetical protein
MLANGPLIAAAPEMLELLRSLDAEAHTVDEFARRFRAFLERRVALLRRIDGEP